MDKKYQVEVKLKDLGVILDFLREGKVGKLPPHVAKASRRVIAQAVASILGKADV